MKVKLTRNNKAWTKEEEDWLRDHWGQSSYIVMSRKLKRTPKAIARKSYRLNLGKIVENIDLICLSEFSKVYYRGIWNKTGMVRKKFIKIGVPIYKKMILKKEVECFNIDDFWKAVKKHPEDVNLKRIEENILGKEPAYIKELRETQTTDDRVKLWSDREANLLAEYVRIGYSNGEIAQLLNRTKESIRAKMKMHRIKRKK